MTREHAWLNYCRAQYAKARKSLAYANEHNLARRYALADCKHWRRELLDIMVKLRGMLS